MMLSVTYSGLETCPGLAKEKTRGNSLFIPYFVCTAAAGAGSIHFYWVFMTPLLLTCD